jgi:TolB-like protein/Tfp pilus assembly protein PilF
VLHLKLFGGVSVTTEQGPLGGRAAQRHRVALLALLAMHRAHALTRDKLIGYLWPEMPEDRARHLLSDSIYRINSAVGTNVVTGVADEVSVNTSNVICDVVQFEDACAHGDFAGAAQLYRGKLLDGFFLPDAESFDEWMSSERERLRRQYIDALEHVADHALSQRDLKNARSLLEKIVAVEPYSSRFSQKLVQIVADAGDTAAALRIGEAHQELLRRDLEVDLPADYQNALQRLRSGPRPRPRDFSIAVLPFADLSPARDNEYFTDGITEELIGAFSRISGARVVARSSVFALKGRNLDIREVGNLLNVSWVVEGSVRKGDGQLRIAVQLVDAGEGFERWSATYTRPAADVLAVQEEIAASVAAQMRSAIRGASEQSNSSVSPEAYDLYLRARHSWHRRGKRDLEAALELFEQVVARAPTYARGWAGLADAYLIAGWYNLVLAREAFPRARTAAQRALELDPQLPAAQVALAYVVMYHDWDLSLAEEQFRRIGAQVPEYSPVHQYYGNLLTAQGRFREAEDEMNRAQELDPLSLIASAAHGWTLYYARRYEASDAKLQSTIQRDQTFHPAHSWRAWAL